jgi:hypothetical protein
MVVCAVICEPISIANSRLLGNLTGNRLIFGLETHRLGAFLIFNQRVKSKFPMPPNRELHDG